MIKAVPMTEKSWILYEKTERRGLMRQTTDGEYTVMGGPYSGKYTNDSSLKKAMNGKLTFEKMKANAEVEKTMVGEYPIKHEAAHELEPTDGVFLYTKTEESNDVYAAGYFSVKGTDKWKTVFSPRYKSLSTSNFHGPYKSKMDAEHETKVENTK